MRTLAAFLVAVCGAAPAARSLAAQQGTVTLPYERSSLELRLLTGGSPGSVEVVDSEAALLSVTDLSGRGGAAVRLEDGVLLLENRSGAPADYRIAVPAGANVSLAVDGRTVLAVAAAGGGRRLSWRWGGQESTRPPANAPATPTAPRRGGLPRLSFRVHAFGGEQVADSVDISETHLIRTLKIVVAGDRFRVSGDRAVSFGWYEPARWGWIIPGASEVGITVEIPAGARLFKVRVDGVVVWELRNGRARTYCEPVAEIVRPDGSELWVFTPDEGRLLCRPPREGPRPA